MEFKNVLIDIFIPAWVLILGAVFLSVFITFKAIKPIINLARLTGLGQIPNHRSSHTDSTPLFGGVAIFAGFTISTVVVAGLGFTYELKFILAGLIILLFIGLKDDIFLIDPRKKLLGQIIASLIIIVLGDIRIVNFYGIFGINTISYIPSVLFTLFVFIVVTNGFNLIDGIDGLASGVGILSSLTFGIWFWINGYISYAVLCFSLAGALVAFFRFNVFSINKKIFLGDTGSLIIGLCLAVIVTRFLQYDIISTGSVPIDSAPAVAIGILIIPLFDTLRVFTLRIASGKSPFKADRLHIHHRLIDLGLSHFESTAIMLLVNALFIALVLILRNAMSEIVISVELVLAIILSYIPVWLISRNSKINKKSGLTTESVSVKKEKRGLFQVLHLLYGFFQF